MLVAAFKTTGGHYGQYAQPYWALISFSWLSIYQNLPLFGYKDMEEIAKIF
jgi:hypothetical protein